MDKRARTAVRLTAVGAVVAAAVGFSTANGAPNGFTNDKSAGLAAQINPAKPRNIILLIGDGTDDSIITAARNYELGAAGRFALDDLPFTGAMTTYGLKTAPDGQRYPINYVSDSAPTASGWSTGKKTVDGRVSQGPSSLDTVPGVDYETVLEIYKKQGKRTGNITTSEITDATPAAAGSHINARACQDPRPATMASCTAERKVNGGQGSIAEQLVDNKIDVLMGGGSTRYAQATDAGPTVLDYAKTTHGYRTISAKADLPSITSLAGGPVLGLFSAGNMLPRYQPLYATAAGAGGTTGARCVAADRGTQPTLAEMTTKAIELLDNPNGFFLQAESAMVDKQEHASDICGAVGDVLELDNALKVAQEFQRKNPDTLIIVTGDHAHSTQIVPNSPTTGKATVTLQTADGDPMTIAYSTQPVNDPPPSTTSQTHTGAQIRVAASGPQAANVTGTIDQTDLFLTLLGRTPSAVGGTPGTPAPPAPVRAPKIALAAAPSTPRNQVKVPVSVAATDATGLTVRLVSKGRTLATKTLGASGGRLNLKTGKNVKGSLSVVATATGAGGTATDTVRVRTTRR